MSDHERWVNAVVHILIPMDDVAVADSKWAKQEASARVTERVMDALPPEMRRYVASGGWEDTR
jgi:hypothetical protein